MNYIAIIPARKGSKEIPGKNIKSLAGKPLIVWSIEQALRSKRISRVIVSTDCNQIAEISKKSGAEVPFLRPKKYAQDYSTTESVLIHAVKKLRLEILKNETSIVLLQPTSPIRYKNSIDKAINRFEIEKADSLVSVNSTRKFYWKNDRFVKPMYDIYKRPMRQKIKKNEIFFAENGSIYITKVKTLSKSKNRLGGRIVLYEMLDNEAFEIDSAKDFMIVKNLMLESKEFVNKIKIKEIDGIIFDFDGVLTDNNVYVSSEGKEMVRCNRSDGYSFEILKKLGLQIFILSSEKNDVVKKRGEKLKIKTISGSKDKKRDLLRLCKNYGLSPKRLIYVGNDINDIDVMRICGLSFAVNDAVEKVKKAADIVLTSNGGEMVAREILNNYLEY